VLPGRNRVQVRKEIKGGSSTAPSQAKDPSFAPVERTIGRSEGVVALYTGDDDGDVTKSQGE